MQSAINPDGQAMTISASSIYFESQPYYVKEEDGLIDYEALAKQVQEFKP